MAVAGVALQQFQLPLTSSSSSSSIFFRNKTQSQKKKQKKEHFHALISKHNSVGCISNSNSKLYLCNNNSRLVVFSGKEDTELQLTQEEEDDDEEEEEEEEEEEATPEDMEYIAQIKRVLELLKKNRDMLFSEVKLTVMIEDPREVERRRLLGIEDADAPTREDLAEALEQVNEGKVPKDRVALRMLAEEMAEWPNLEVEAPKKKSSKSLYARVTDTGIDPELAAKKLNVDWDSAAEIGEADDSDEAEVPAAVHFNLRPHPCSLCPFNSMAPPASAVVLPVVSKITQEPNEFVDDLHELNFLAFGDEPDTLVKRESPQNEKQISVDPISLSLREPSFNFMLPPVLTSPRDTTVPLPAVPPVLPPAKTKFISCSLPSSATSSPRFGSILSMRKWKINENQPSPKQVDNLVRQRSLAHSRFSLVKDAMLVKSKSCGEGRASAPSDELELCFSKPKAPEYNKISHTNFSKAETNRDVYKNVNNVDPCDENFKCGALCMFLPGFGKAKPERARKEEAMENVISRTVSLEKFECGSWASSAIVHDHDEDGDSMNHLYFDLPLELIRNNSNDAHCPINSAFVFDKDLKGVLKNGSTSGRTSARKSHESSRHVRFSVSSPTPSYSSSPASCITPRLRKAREDFNAFLEAQSA